MYLKESFGSASLDIKADGRPGVSSVSPVICGRAVEIFDSVRNHLGADGVEG